MSIQEYRFKSYIRVKQLLTFKIKKMKSLVFIIAIIATLKIIAPWSNQLEPNYVAQKQPVIIWNDDYEAIPPTGEMVKVDFVSNDTIYLVNP